MGSVCTGICAYFYMCNLVSVVVFQRSLVNWRRGWGLSALVEWSSRDVWLIGGGGGVCLHWYLCILLYVKLIRVVVFHRSMVDWRRGWGLSALVSVHTSICET